VDAKEGIGLAPEEGIDTHDLAVAEPCQTDLKGKIQGNLGIAAVTDLGCRTSPILA
jgi:hypothetical protein